MKKAKIIRSKTAEREIKLQQIPPDSAPHDFPDIVPGDTPEVVPGDLSEVIPGAISQNSHEEVPDTALSASRTQDESEAKRLLNELNQLARKSARAAFDLGCVLCRLKAKIKRGAWETYVKDQLGIEPRSASNYMRIWKGFHDREDLAALLQSETFSDLGVRDLLNLLADDARRSKDGDDAPPLSTHRGESKGDLANHSPDCPTFGLADGSKLNVRHVKWSPGPISRDALDTWLDKTRSDGTSKDAVKQISRLQRVVVTLAAGVNQSCGRAEVGQVATLFEESIDAIRKLLGQENGDNAAD